MPFKMLWLSAITGNHNEPPLHALVAQSSLLNMRCHAPKAGSLPLDNEIRDLTANLLTEVCNDVCIEPDLQPITGEVLAGASSNAQGGARLDIAANGFSGGRFEHTFF